MRESEIRARIRQLHDSGDIPCDDELDGKLWAGPGRGRLCAICMTAIEETETEFEVDLSSGKILRVHRQCYSLWLEECGEVTGAG
ncbi:MAG TPA: hypothetical protein VHZ49_21515 [Methylomirabilota bacterium]|jgi:hypothetical protein|nr:hypothetical protein [Methylomirabilota bacterium]